MYDARHEPHEFIAEDREAAIEKARAFFGLDVEQLTIQELVAGEVYGLGGRSVVVAFPRDRKPPVRSERPSGERRGREGREREGRDREGRGGRDRGGRGGREGREGREGRGYESRERPPREATRPSLPELPSVGTELGPLGEIGRFVKGAIERLEVGPFEIRETEDDANTVIEVKGAAAEVLSAGEARALDALQLLANQVLSRRDEDAPGRVVLDVAGGSESRERHLERLAERVVKRAIEGGRAIALDPMNARDRRTIHVSVRGHDDVATMSIGEGRFRQVVIVPKGAPEYEEALRQSRGTE